MLIYMHMKLTFHNQFNSRVTKKPNIVLDMDNLVVLEMAKAVTLRAFAQKSSRSTRFCWDL